MLPSRVPTIDPGLSVNEVLRRWPGAVTALNAYGVDTCCGGAASLSEAAGQAGVSVDDLIGGITDALTVDRGDQ
jgi:regulator of cell morphogenesis and NO signaling